MNIKEMFELIDKNELVLPDFQRNFVWNKAGQRALAASILLNFPIGSFLILEGKRDDFATKKLGFSTQEATPTTECKFLLDGQQRLTSLRSIFADFFTEEDWKNTIRGIYNSLRTKWFIRIVPEKCQEDIFGWKNLVFDKELLRNIEPSQLEEMIVDKPIGITKINCWWNPEYTFMNQNGEKINKESGRKYLLQIGKEMAKENLLPLSIYNETDRTLLDYALDYISKERAMELKVDLENDIEKAKHILDNADIIYDEVNDENLESVLDELRQKWKLNVSTYLKDILKNTDSQIISLKSDEISRAVIIFERINKGGTNLDNFDLVVARAARDSSGGSLTKRIITYFEKKIELSYALTSNIKGEKPKNINLSCMETVKNNEIDSVVKNQYLNLLSILCYVDYGNIDEIKIDFTKKEKILNISYQQINKLTDQVLKGLSRAISFLQIRCGIVKIKDLHYKLMILPIAYILVSDEAWENQKVLDKIEYWYWGSIFAGEYRLYPNQVCIDDIRDLYNWIVNNKTISRYDKFESNIFTIKDFSDKETLIGENDKEIPVAIHKGLLQYELSRQPNDLYYNDILLNSWDIANEKEINKEDKKVKLEIQDHHIIPLATSTNLQESTKKIREKKEHILNSILNRTYILGETNRIFSSNEPRKYLKCLEEENNTHMLNTHFIPDDYKSYLNSNLIDKEDNIKEFYKHRFDKIKTIIYSELSSLKN
ncbi:DUF262 domain-containing protein [Clostridium botulinum]|nr:DUF262 domain-containing protein [Clostridium botulinum]NFP02349.1 DUF262 domain-containing protein [Clostridium botulinum]